MSSPLSAHAQAPSSPAKGEPPSPTRGSQPKDAAPSTTKERTQPSAPPDDAATRPALPPGQPAGTGVLRTPGVPDRDVPLMSIQKDESRVQVGPVTPETGVADVLLGSLGIVAVAVIGSLILGAVLGVVLVFVKHRLGWGGPDKDEEDHITLTNR